MRREALLRVGLVLVGLPNLLIGAWARIDPTSFYEDFPGFGHHWASASGPYNDHFITDFGAALAALSLLVLYAAWVMDRRIVRASLVAFLVLGIPHFVFHAGNQGTLDDDENTLSLASLLLNIALPLVLLWMTGTGRRSRTGRGRARSRARL